MPGFSATLPGGSREFTRGVLFDAGLDLVFNRDPIFFLATVDYGVSAELRVLSGSFQVGAEVGLGELLVPLALRGSAGLLIGHLKVESPNFGKFDSGVGLVLRVELAGQIDRSLFASFWLEYRQMEFDFQPAVTGGDDAAGGAMIAGGFSLSLQF